MKLSKSAVAVALCALLAVPVLAEEKPLQFSIGVDFAYAPASEKVGTGVETNVLRFAPVTGIFSGVEGRINLGAVYTIPTPLGSHWLVSDANVQMEESLEITPITVAPSAAVTFTPVPFIVLNAGFKVGTGWGIGGLQGIAQHSPTLEDLNKYDNFKPFGNLYAKYWAQGTFQFDTGAIFSGDWTHVQTLYTYQVYYEGLTGVADKDLWCWQASDNKVNGVKEYQSAILAYQMPTVLSRVGIMFESDKYYNPAVYGNPNFKGDFREINLSALGQFSFTEKDTLTVLINFENRRTYKVYEENLPESDLTCSGTEWFFRRVAFSYTHNF